MNRHALGLTLVFAMLLAGCIGTEPLEENNLDDETDIEALKAPLSEAIHDEILHTVKHVPSTHDDAELRVDVYQPDTDETVPTILILSPYWSFAGDAKDDELNEGYPTWYIDYFAPRGYAIALGEMRSTRDSGGCWDFGGELDQQDGHDIVQALAAEDWSNGKVGMIGASHVGMSQIAAAVTAPPNLTTIVPIAAVSDWYRYLHMDGTQYETNRGTPPAYFAVHASPSTQPLTDGSITPDWVQDRANTATCTEHLEHLSQSAEFDGNKDAYWAERDLVSKAGNINASVYLVHGFQDENVKTDHFSSLWEALPEDVDKRGWFGQFGHALPFVHEWRNEVHAWFDHELKGIDNGIMDRPAVTTQASNEDARMETHWPPANIERQELPLGGDDLSLDEDALPGPGAISAGLAQEAVETVSYWSIPGDDRGAPGQEANRRVSFSTDAVQEPLQLVGQARLTLEGTLDQAFGQWIAVLYEVEAGHELGDAEGVEEITRSYLNAEHRDGNEEGEPVPAGEALAYEMRFFSRDHVVEEGNRIVLALLGGDMGCLSGMGVCEGTGIVPQAGPVEHTVAIGPDSLSTLEVPVQEAFGPERALTPLDGWLEDTPE